jgi:S1-C subfamily serine protease
MRKVADLVQDLIAHLSTTTRRPEYVYVKGTALGGRGPAGPRLRFMPAYGQDDEEGVLIGGVIDKGPADKAGLKEGDRIVELAGKPVKNIQTFMVLMRSQKVGQPLEVVILRKGKKMTVTAIPE